MSLFTSKREERLWLYAVLVLVAIILTLIFSTEILRLIDDQTILAAGIITSMLLIGLAVLVHGLKKRPGKNEITVWLGLIAVYLLLIVRLGHPERTHLMEYSVLAIFIHKALIERYKAKDQSLKPAILAFSIAFVIGLIDEFIQIYLPDRVFDVRDILFNSLAAFMAIGASLVLRWARKKFKTNRH